MKRRTFTATMFRDGELVAEQQTFAWNSAVRASESLVGEYARELGTYFMGRDFALDGKPGAPGATYSRDWSGAGQTVTVMVQEVI